MTREDKTTVVIAGKVMFAASISSKRVRTVREFRRVDRLGRRAGQRMVLCFAKVEKKTPAPVYKAASIPEPAQYRSNGENPSCRVEAKKPWQRRQG